MSERAREDEGLTERTLESVRASEIEGAREAVDERKKPGREVLEDRAVREREARQGCSTRLKWAVGSIVVIINCDAELIVLIRESS